MCHTVSSHVSLLPYSILHDLLDLSVKKKKKKKKITPAIF
jgi:hypothetical protein